MYWVAPTFGKDLSILVCVCGQNGEKERKQKRLVLANFKASHPGANIGFSTFASIPSPFWLVHLAHIVCVCLCGVCVVCVCMCVCVCVCVHHQTPKLKASVCDLA